MKNVLFWNISWQITKISWITKTEIEMKRFKLLENLKKLRFFKKLKANTLKLSNLIQNIISLNTVIV